MTEAPLYVDVVIIAVYVLLAVTLAASLYAAWHGVRTHSRQRSALDLRHASAVSYGSLVLPVVCLFVTYWLGSSEPLTINGHLFTDTFWLRVTDMFIYTSILLIILCFVIVLAARFRH
jgi:uncharacterized membrane protein YidH (DUF202 family)